MGLGLELARALRWLVALALVAGMLLALLWPPAAWGMAERVAEDAGPTSSDRVGRLASSGADLFTNHCAGCHSQGGNIIRRGKTLKLGALERNGIDGPEAIAAIAAQGIGQMGGYADVLGEGGEQVVADWVWGQALAGWPKP